MSISSQTSRVSYTGNGNNDTYAYTFKIFDEDDLTVKVREVSSGDETTLVKTTDYTVTGVGETLGGNVVLVDNSQAWIDAEGDLDSGWVLVIRRDPDLVQETDIRNQGTYYPEGIENQFDKLVHIDQKQQDEISRSLKLKDTLDPADFDMKLPIDIDTPDVVLATNSTGDGFAIGPTIDEVSNAQGYATAAAASAALAEEWASETASIVDATDYSSKEWAIGVQTRGDASGGSSKDWANYTGGTVDDTEYSSKHYAQEAASEASDAAASAAAASAAVNSAFFRDVVYIDNTDSPVTLVSGDNGKIYVADTSGGAISVTLPQISLITPPFNIAFKLQTAGNDLTINRAGTDTIDGATTKVLSVAQTGTQMAADPDLSPDDWTSIDFGTVGDGTVTEAKLASSVSTSEEKFNLGLATSVGSNALTIALKQADGITDPSSGSPVRIAFRHSTVTNGGYELINVTSALSTVISSGSTLGHTSGVEGTIHVYALNNSGTVELCYSSIMHNETVLQSTTAEGGAGAADSANVLYSTTARSNVPIRYLGRIKITEATAGTWASNATNINVPEFMFKETEVVEGSVTTETTYSITAGTYGDLTSFSLTPGEWELSGSMQIYNNGATTYSQVQFGFGTASGTGTTGMLFPKTTVIDNRVTGTSGQYILLNVCPFKVTLTSTTTYYLKSRINTSITNVQYLYHYNARRIK